MFEKDKSLERYTREEFTMEEQLYNYYIQMRKVMHSLENFKYGTEDKFQSSEDFKQGFLAGIKILSSILLDI